MFPPLSFSSHHLPPKKTLKILKHTSDVGTTDQQRTQKNVRAFYEKETVWCKERDKYFTK